MGVANRAVRTEGLLKGLAVGLWLMLLLLMLLIGLVFATGESADQLLM